MTRTQALGRSGEDLAVDHLEAQGYTILDRNWRCSIGEVDIVAREGATTVVVEVKTRSGSGFGHPLEAITPVKLARLRRLAAAWWEAKMSTVHRSKVIFFLIFFQEPDLKISEIPNIDEVDGIYLASPRP